ncbi:MAG: sugar phosphate isomerase/epimerase [Thaumarchaeota archaeon]|nr:sugar phosphate isomerase/epimerase [Nitrososphaerota archaeon]
MGVSSLFLYKLGKGMHDLGQYIESDPFRQPQPAIWQVIDDGPQELVGSNLKEAKELVSKGFRISVHSPSGIHFNLAHHNAQIRAQVIRRMKNSLDSAGSCEALWWTMHPGYDIQGGSRLDEAKKNNDESIQELWDYAHSVGIVLLVENAPPEPGFDMTSPERFIDISSQTGIKLKVAFDLGHSKISGNVANFIDRLSKAFVTVECSDNDGKRDLHLTLEEDNLEWKKTIDHLCDIGYGNAYIVETNEDPLPSFSSLSTYISKRFLLS